MNIGDRVKSLRDVFGVAGLVPAGTSGTIRKVGSGAMPDCEIHWDGYAGGAFVCTSSDYTLVTQNEWDTWKVGDRLQCRCPTGQCRVGDIVTVKYNGLSSVQKGLVIFTRETGRDGGVADSSPIDNPSTYFFWLGPSAAPVWTKGDRVRREAIKDSPSGIPAGTEGVVHSVQDDLIAVIWDGYGLHSYDLPLRHALFSKIGTLQSPRPVLCCARCGEYNEYAEANQADGTHKCFLCRKYPYR